MTTLLAALLLAAPAQAKGDPCADEAAVAEASAQLKALHEADDADHKAPTTATEEAGDKRAKEVAKLVKKGLVCTPQDKWYAASVLRRSDKARDVATAFELAEASMMAHVHSGAWLTAMLFDLREVTLGQPQRYGSQMGKKGAKTCLYPLATDATDAERAQYDMPPISDAYRRLLDANNLTQAPATWDAVDEADLWCEP